ncbi:MAG TPA: peptidase M16, partial [Devosiaceae bacterium]|nr:peptidase M16 [Devosiaceae bacterium]
FESRLVPAGHNLAELRLRAALHPAAAANEEMGGPSYLKFLRRLAKDVETDWDQVQKALETIRDTLFDRTTMLCDVTAEADVWRLFEPELERFLRGVPAPGGTPQPVSGTLDKRGEGLAIPSAVNFVAKGANLPALGLAPTGATAAVTKYLNNTWLWDRVRVRGGAYGGTSRFDALSGGLVFLSYRDPNVLATLDAYDGAGAFLGGDISPGDVTRSIIGAIGEADRPLLADAKGMVSMQRWLCGLTDDVRQERRDQLLGATVRDFHAFGAVLAEVARAGHVVAIGSETALQAALAERPGLFEIEKLL